MVVQGVNSCIKLGGGVKSCRDKNHHNHHHAYRVGSCSCSVYCGWLATAARVARQASLAAVTSSHGPYSRPLALYHLYTCLWTCGGHS